MGDVGDPGLLTILGLRPIELVGHGIMPVNLPLAIHSLGKVLVPVAQQGHLLLQEVGEQLDAVQGRGPVGKVRHTSDE
eukprot:14537669-Heterocapsa_arctica.AAC.1